MIYLSQLWVDPSDQRARRDLAAPYELHRTLARAFPDPESTEHRARHGVLFRAEEPAPSGAPVLVQSTTEPDWSLLPQGYAARVDGPKPFDPALEAGQRLRFRLLANPVRRVAVGGKRHARRMPLVHPLPDPDAGRPDGYLPWLLRQADRHGFALSTADGPRGPEPVVDHAAHRDFSKRQLGADLDKRRLPHLGVQFDGALTVRDPEALLAAVRHGVGPAKAYGFGLLSLAPV